MSLFSSVQKIKKVSIAKFHSSVKFYYSTSSIIRTSFIRHSIIRPLGQIIIYDITNTFPVNVGQ